MKLHSWGMSSFFVAVSFLIAPPVYAAKLPDLVVTSLSMSPANPKAGDAVTLKAVVKNQGTKATPAGIVLTVRFEIDGATVSWSDTYSRALSAGSSITLTANSGPSGSATFKAPAGTHEISAWANDNTSFKESNTSNNTRTKSVTFTGTTPTPTPTPVPKPTVTPTPTPVPTLTPTPTPAPTATPTPPPSGGMKPQNSCLPFQEYTVENLRAKPKKVFAHYFYPFPLSLDNRPTATDYYTENYLNPFGENSKFLAGGGFIRARPLPLSPLADQNNYWRINLQTEVRRAIAMGLDGFTFNIMDTKDEGWDIALALLDAAQIVDPKFKIMLMPDLTAITLDQVDIAVAGFYNHPSAFKLDDGRLVVTPFYGEGATPAQWSAKLTQLKNKGYNIALMPLGLNVSDSFLKNYAPVSAGFSDWGPRDEDNAAGMEGQGAVVHQYASIYMAPVAPNDVRPKDLSYYESHNSASFRNLWMSAINGNADWVQLITWSDYSEHTHISPSLGQKGEMQRTYYDLSAFYLTWFKMGSQPAITNDMLYYFHRRHKANLQPSSKAKQTGTFKIEYGTPYDEIEVVAFLKSPGRVEITTGSKTSGMDMPAGINVFRVPMETGVPSFKLIRNNAAVISFKSQTEILSSIETSDYSYQSGSASAAGTCYTFPEP